MNGATPVPAPDLRPSHIVLFQETASRNTSVFADILGVREEHGIQSRSSRTVLTKRNWREARPIVYEALGVAVASLNPNEIERLQDAGRVQLVLPNRQRSLPRVIQAKEARDGPSSRTDGHSDSSGMTYSWCLSMLGIDPSYTLTGNGVRVAVLDTGIDLEHPDFEGRFPGGNDLQSFVEDETVQDRNGHGTHCAGVVAGAAKSKSRRRYSVAPQAELLVGKVLNDEGKGNDDRIIDGLDWARDVGAQVVSLSLGSTRTFGEPYDPLYEVLADNLLNSGNGILLVAAAGNDSLRPNEIACLNNPGACPSVLAVGAVDRERKVASFSNGAADGVGTLAMCAPGKPVFSAWINQSYQTISGTSMAVPHVAGVAALMLEMNPGLSARELRRFLEEGALASGPPEEAGRGVVQAPVAR